MTFWPALAGRDRHCGRSLRTRAGRPAQSRSDNSSPKPGRTHVTASRRQNLKTPRALLSPLCSGLSTVSPGGGVTRAHPGWRAPPRSRAQRQAQRSPRRGALRPPRAGLRPGLGLSPQQQSVCPEDSALFSKTLSGRRACPGARPGSPDLASRGHRPSQGRASSGRGTGEESLSPPGWSKVGGEPGGRRGQEVEFKAHSKRQEGPEAPH